ncbi:hypothetical protein [Conexibacter sp. CPCC 206217]|uniref:hypothetical protein n=1 Tax=Conexibacter sp. CPCC 206217 TaxID=3064574 RepID=UPI0027204AB3|nr:hypothetical protein [Conexibacter sp. CPCC 206217]MDO8210925.1 hypothetical protein [Conexibacter sp. CPCC 206217]
MSSEVPQQPTEAEIKALQEQLKNVRVEAVVLESAMQILNVAIMRAGMMPGMEGERDLNQVRVGIEGVRALLPLVELITAPEDARQFKDALSQLQLVYVQAAEQAQAGEPDAGPAPGAPRPAGPGAGGPAPGTGSAPQPPQQQPRRPEGPGGGRLWIPGQ